MSTTFVATGLLDDPGPSQPSKNGPAFESTGLLDFFEEKDLFPVISTAEDSAASLDAPVPPKATSVFVSNGLLDLEEDDMPTIEEALGIPPPAIQSVASSSTRHIRATTFSGKTIWLKRKLKLPRQKNPVDPTTHRVGNLLDVPIHRLLEQLSISTALKLSDADAQTPQLMDDNKDDATLWVDRYRPQRFTDLMGNERVAREAMAWVKQWDRCVFGRKKAKKRMKADDEPEEEPDEFHRPQQKLLLLSGPPGLGKTTLAHVIARHAGYATMEINASDARSGQVVDDRIRPALESGFTVGSDKPLLLIIDEIDGATGGSETSSGFIHKLIQLTQDKPRKKGRYANRDPQRKRPILRPIICICNDLNASALAKLRPIAFQLRYQRPADIHTVKRLREVCEIEGLRADQRALTTLVAVARGDLRSCLNTLQFVKSRNEDVTETVIRGATRGMGDGDMSITAVLTDLFVPLSKKRVKELGMNEEDENKYVARLSRELDACGKESSIAVGCFAHYATLRQHDANLSRYHKANEWLTTFDRFSAAMYNDGDFAMNQYLPYSLVPFYPLFHERGGPKIERNQADWENLQTTRANEEIYKSLVGGLQTASTRRGGDYRHLVSTPVLQLEFAPYINRIISPPLRPINSQIIKPEEKAVLTRLVNIMASLELRFVQERGEDGQLAYRLDPPVDVFVTYDGKRAADIAISRYAVRHLVAGEVDTELLARHAEIIDKSKRGKHDFFGKSAGKANDQSSPGKRSAESDLSATPNKRARTNAAVDIADRPPTDFFGRLITVTNDTVSENCGVPKVIRVAYKFREGNSAAVRKPVKVGSFL
ncbi:hypothetical protein C8J56DRAFT_1015638 [Mycena floridula]|nr:hypothetical protein C8J56DRAFT_1015638 [Mycena floridula]